MKPEMIKITHETLIKRSAARKEFMVEYFILSKCRSDEEPTELFVATTPLKSKEEAMQIAIGLSKSFYDMI